MSSADLQSQIEGYMPLDKSQVIRFGFLDLVNGYPQDITRFLDSQDQSSLGGDFKALRRVIENWPYRFERPFDVGESGTIYRAVQYYRWLNNIPHEPIVSGTLVTRSKKEMVNSPDIVNWSIDEVRKLDHYTTQWATMKYLFSKPEERQKAKPIVYRGKRLVRDGDFKLKLTYDCVDYWEKQREKNFVWEARKDPTFVAQATAFVNALLTGKMEFKGEQAEDYCFERAFDLIDAEEGQLVYPTVEGHETNRFVEMERAMKIFRETGVIDSVDHRVVPPLVMKQILIGEPYEVMDRKSVNKTWPRFWDFVKFAEGLKRRITIDK